MRHVKALTLSLSKILAKQELSVETTGKMETHTEREVQKCLASGVDKSIRTTYFIERVLA